MTGTVDTGRERGEIYSPVDRRVYTVVCWESLERRIWVWAVFIVKPNVFRHIRYPAVHY